MLLDACRGRAPSFAYSTRWTQPFRVPDVVATSDNPVMMVTRRVAGDWLWYLDACGLDGERLDRTATDLATFLTRLHRPDILAAARDAGVELPAPNPQATTRALRERFGAFVDPRRHRRVREWCDWADEARQVGDPPALPRALTDRSHRRHRNHSSTLGALRMRTDPALALTGRRCVSTRLLDTGFEFHHPKFDSALQSLLVRS